MAPACAPSPSRFGQKTGVAGFVFPGDHVDLVLTQTVKGQRQGEPLKAAETILRNLRVLATDQSTETETEDGKTVVRAFRTSRSK